jgi:outer membrane protein assembly factor BamB
VQPTSSPSFRVVWSRLLQMRSDSVAVAAGSVVVAERHSRVVRLDADSGRVRWERRVEDCWGTLVVAGGRCLYLSQAGVLHCIEMAGGQRLWSVPDLPLRHHVAVNGSVVFVGGWRGYHPLTRVSLADGVRLGLDLAAIAGAGPLARPFPVDGEAVVIAGEGLAVLWLMAASGDVLAEWALPEPVAIPDSGDAFRVADDGRVTFRCGRRTVMVLEPGDGVRVLWEHERDIGPYLPMLHEHTLWLVDSHGIAVIDLARGVVNDVPYGGVRAAATVSGEALFALKDGWLVGVDQAGVARRMATRPARISRLLPGGDGLVHAFGKGHLTTFRVPPVGLP